MGALIRSMKFLSPEFVLYLYKSTIWPCTEYCYNALVGSPSCHLEMLDKLQKRVYGTVVPSIPASLESLAHRQNVTSLNLFYKYYSGRCSSELAELVPLLFSRRISTRCSDRSHDFYFTLRKCYKDAYINMEFSVYRMLSFKPMISMALCLELTHLLSAGSF